MNHDWVWGPDNPTLDKAASLAVEIRDADPDHLEALLRNWLGGLNHDPGQDGHYRGGYGVRILSRGSGSAHLVFTSGGQDVAESLGDGVDTFCEQVLQPLSTVSVVWTELPLH